MLKGALSEDLLIQSFQKMGYVRRDAHRLMVAALPPARQLVQVALGQGRLWTLPGGGAVCMGPRVAGRLLSP